MHTAKDVMTKTVITVPVEVTVEQAIRTLIENRISGAPVTDQRGYLKGIISEFQLLEVIYAPRKKRDLVKDYMTRDVVTVTESTPLTEVASLLVLRRLRRLPVMRGQEIVGLVSRRDLLRNAIDAREDGEPGDHVAHALGVADRRPFLAPSPPNCSR